MDLCIEKNNNYQHNHRPAEDYIIPYQLRLKQLEDTPLLPKLTILGSSIESPPTNGLSTGPLYHPRNWRSHHIRGCLLGPASCPSTRRLLVPPRPYRGQLFSNWNDRIRGSQTCYSRPEGTIDAIGDKTQSFLVTLFIWSQAILIDSSNPHNVCHGMV